MLLIRLTTPTELTSYEGCALALTLATFGHDVQLYLGEEVFGLLMQTNSRLHGMIKSLDLYDMPTAWLAHGDISDWLLDTVEPNLFTQLKKTPQDFDSQNFAQILTF